MTKREWKRRRWALHREKRERRAIRGLAAFVLPWTITPDRPWFTLNRVKG